MIHSCEFDEYYPPEAIAATDAILGGGKFKPGYKREHWDGVHHGFAIRGDLSDPQVTKAKEGAFKSAVQWFIDHM